MKKEKEELCEEEAAKELRISTDIYKSSYITKVACVSSFTLPNENICST